VVYSGAKVLPPAARSTTARALYGTTKAGWPVVSGGGGVDGGRAGG